MLFYYSCQTLQLSCMNSIITVFFKLSRILLPSLRGRGKPLIERRWGEALEFLSQYEVEL